MNFSNELSTCQPYKDCIMDKSKGLKCDVTDFLRNGENYLDVLVEKGMLSQKDANEYLRLARAFVEENQEVVRLACELFLRFFLNGNPLALDQPDTLADYFVASFKGIGPSHPINFYAMLREALHLKRNDIDYARIALLIYQSNKLQPQKRPKSFATWYRIFCKSIGCKYHSHYRPNKLIIHDSLRKELYYL